MLTERLVAALESIARSLKRLAEPEGTAESGVVVSLDLFRERKAHCPGCGNLKGKRHGQGCAYIVPRKG